MADAVLSFDVVDIHIGGDVHRIVLDGVEEVPGESVFEQMKYLQRTADGLRKVLLDEPRGGHPALFADLVVRPCHARAEAGFIIMENNGYPMFSGTNIMSTTIALLESGRLPAADGVRKVVLEAPGGLVDIWANCKRRRVLSVTCQPSRPVFMYDTDLCVEVPGRGPVVFDLIWAGEFFPVIDAVAYGFKMERGEEYQLGGFAMAFVRAAQPLYHPRHPEIDDPRPLGSVVFVGPPEKKPEGAAERRVVPYVYPNHQVGRCPGGMPSAVAIAQLYFRGEVTCGDKLRTSSLIGTFLDVELTGEERTGQFDGVKVAITGRGWTVGRTTVIVDLSDPMTPTDGLAKILKRSAVG